MTEKIIETIHHAFAGDGEAIFLIFSVYMAAMALYSLAYQLRVRAWPSVYGKLLDTSIVKASGLGPNDPDSDYLAEALYEFTVHGETYSGSKISAWQIVASKNARAVLEKQLRLLDFDTVGRVRIYHDPMRPEKALLLKPGALGICVTILIGVGPIALYFLR